MKNCGFRRSVTCVGLAGLLFVLSLPCMAAGAPEAGPIRQMGERELQSLFGPLDPAQIKPDFTDLGGGLYTFSIPLDPALRERLLAALPATEMGGGDAKAVQTLFAISAGQSPLPPTDPITTTHGALSDSTFGYNYWFIVLNLGTRDVTRKTTLKLSGPGLKFNRVSQVGYRANGIWLVGYSPNRGVGVPGVYTFQATVDGGGSITNKTFAVVP